MNAKVCSLLKRNVLKYPYKGEQNMTGKTHASCGFLVGAITTQYFHTDIFTSISVIVLSVISSILPDICHTQSKIGRRFRLTSFLSEFYLVIEHLRIHFYLL